MSNPCETNEASGFAAAYHVVSYQRGLLHAKKEFLLLTISLVAKLLPTAATIPAQTAAAPRSLHPSSGASETARSADRTAGSSQTAGTSQTAGSSQTALTETF
jgi:hypothetical protein